MNTEGTEVTISQHPPFFLTGLDGFDAVASNMTIETTHRTDGGHLTDKRLSVRDMTITGEIVARSSGELAAYRRELVKAFNLYLAGTLIYEEGGKKYSIDIEVEHAPMFNSENKSNITQEFQIMLKALDPYWRDTSFYDSLIPISTVVNKFRFPLRITNEFVFATMKSGDIVAIDNNGDVEVGAIFNMKIIGEVVNPRIYDVLAQEYFGFKGTYGPGTEFRISTIKGKKEVTKTTDNGVVNAMPERMKDSTFLTLKKSSHNKTNYFQVQADSGVNAVVVDVNFSPLVMGV